MYVKTPVIANSPSSLTLSCDSPHECNFSTFRFEVLFNPWAILFRLAPMFLLMERSRTSRFCIMGSNWPRGKEVNPNEKSNSVKTQVVNVGAGKGGQPHVTPGAIVSHSFHSGWNKAQPTLTLWLSGCLLMGVFTFIFWEGPFRIPLTHKCPIFRCEVTIHKLKCLYLAPFLKLLEGQRQISSHFTVPGQVQLFQFKYHLECFSCYKRARRWGRLLIHKAGNPPRNQHKRDLWNDNGWARDWSGAEEQSRPSYRPLPAGWAPVFTGTAFLDPPRFRSHASV